MSKQESIHSISDKMGAAGIRVGTSVRTKFMRRYTDDTSSGDVYSFNTEITLARIRTAGKMIARIGADGLIVCSGRAHTQTPVERFCELTGAKKILSRFMPGTLTNPSLPYYIEPRLVLISDPAVDGQAIIEATNAGIPVIGMSNTDNITSKIDLVIPTNNRGRQSLAATYWMLAREVLVARSDIKDLGAGDDMRYSMDLDIEDFEDQMSDADVDETETE